MPAQTYGLALKQSAIIESAETRSAVHIPPASESSRIRDLLRHNVVPTRAEIGRCITSIVPVLNASGSIRPEYLLSGLLSGRFADQSTDCPAGTSSLNLG
jgi:hypothetical protein